MRNRVSLWLGAALLSVASFAIAADLPLVDGVVKKIDLAAKKITIAHGDIPNLNMKPMTMPYAVKNPDELKKLHEGDKVKFTADKVDKIYTVIHIEPAK